MKRSKSTEAQIAFIPRQAEEGTAGVAFALGDRHLLFDSTSIFLEDLTLRAPPRLVIRRGEPGHLCQIKFKLTHENILVLLI